MKDALSPGTNRVPMRYAIRYSGTMVNGLGVKRDGHRDGQIDAECQAASPRRRTAPGCCPHEPREHAAATPPGDRPPVHVHKLGWSKSVPKRAMCRFWPDRLVAGRYLRKNFLGIAA